MPEGTLLRRMAFFISSIYLLRGLCLAVQYDLQANEIGIAYFRLPSTLALRCSHGSRPSFEKQWQKF